MSETDRTILTEHLTAMVHNEYEVEAEDREYCAFGKESPESLEDSRKAVVAAVKEQGDRFRELLFGYLENADEAIGTTEDGRTIYGSMCRDERERLTDLPAGVYVEILEKIDLDGK